MSQLSHDFGWTREQAIGALANFAHESRGRAIEQLGMPAGVGGFGWAQWTGARRYAFMAFARTSGMSPASDAANYAFLAHELRTNFAFVAQRMRQARNAAEATVIFARDYEGAFSPGAITSMPSRRLWAQALGAMTVRPIAAAGVAPTRGRPAVAAAMPVVEMAAAIPVAPAYRAPIRIVRIAAPFYARGALAYRVSGSAYTAAARTRAVAVPAAYGMRARTYTAYLPAPRFYGVAPRFYGAAPRFHRATARFYGAAPRFYGATARIHRLARR